MSLPKDAERGAERFDLEDCPLRLGFRVPAMHTDRILLNLLQVVTHFEVKAEWAP